MRRVLVSAILLLITGCVYGDTRVPPGATKLWTAMTHAERANHMAVVVSPRMSAVFKDFDAERFADFSCATCHGPRASDRSFAMPNPNLPRLDERFFYAEHRENTPRMFDFMLEMEAELAKTMGVTYARGSLRCTTCHLTR